MILRIESELNRIDILQKTTPNITCLVEYLELTKL